MIFFQAAMAIRLKAVHVVNVSPALEKIYAIFKPFIKAELQDLVITKYTQNWNSIDMWFFRFQLHIHSSVDELQNYLPKDCIPKDLGGDGPSFDEIHGDNEETIFVNQQFLFFILDDQCKRIDANAKYIQGFGMDKADESLRQKKINFGHMFGYEGTFKKLEID